jgi:hypothetical protein
VRALALLVLLIPSTASADEAWRAWQPRLDVEPAAFFLHGYSVHVGAQPPAMPRLLLSTGAYAFDVPDLLVDFSGEDSAEWNVRLFFGAGVFAEYFVGAQPDRGWLVGGQLGVQRYEVTDRAAMASRFTDALLLVRGGYEWHPGGYGFYIYPWIGAAFTAKVGGDDGGYAPRAVVPYVTADIGWRL